MSYEEEESEEAQPGKKKQKLEYLKALLCFICGGKHPGPDCYRTDHRKRAPRRSLFVKE